MKRFLLPLLMVFAIAALLIGTAPAEAAFKLSLDDLGDAAPAFVITDNDMNDRDPTVGIIDFSGSIGAFTSNISVGSSKPAIGSPSVAKMDLFDVSISGGAGSLVLMLTDTDFVILGQENGFRLVNDIGGTTDGTVTSQGYLDPTNIEFGTVVPPAYTTGLQGPFGPGAFSDSTAVNIPPLGVGVPFSLTEVVTVTHRGAGITSFDKELQTVPEPGTMLLIGTGLLGLAGLGRRKLRKK